MTKRFSKCVLAELIVASLALEAAPAFAQLEEVIVTARKREESIMQVPVVATTLSGELLQQYAITDMSNISQMVPGLNVGDQVLTSGVQVTMRGVGTATLNPAVDQSVALNVDGMQMTQGFAYRMALFDMEHIEVLKGPQALFFGKASPAGVISVRTADPGETVEFIARGGYEFETDEKMTELILSGPLTDSLSARLSGKYADADGYFENTAVPAHDPIAEALTGDGSLGGRNPDSRNFDEHEYWMTRATVLWNPNSRFNARLKLNYAHDETPNNGGLGQLASCPDGTGGLYFDFIGGSEDCRVDDVTNILSLNPEYFPNVKNGGQPFTEADQQFHTVEWTYALRDDLDLTSVTGWYDIEVETMINGTQTTQYAPIFAANNDLERDDFTQELRITSDYDGPVNFLAGAFYQEGTTDFLVDLPFNQAFARLQGVSLLSLATATHQVDAEALSFFGQALWNITPQLELGLGARWTDEERTHKVVDFSAVASGGSPFQVDLAKPKLSSDSWSPELTLTYTPTDDLTVFGSLKRAYKSGSFDIAGLPTDGADTSFDDERVRSLELGIKSRMLDGRLSYNAAGYYYEFNDLQVERSDFDASTGQILTHTDNAASADIYGVDIDAAFIPARLDALTLYGALNWNKAEYDEWDNAVCWGGQLIAEGCDRLYDPRANAGRGGFTAQDLSGEPLLRAPEWSANLGFDYTTPVFEQMTLVIGSQLNYSSKYLTDAIARDDMYQDSFTKVRASVALRGRQDAWELAVIGDNLTDELVSGNCPYTDYANAGFGDMITGADVRGGSGVAEIACNVEPGRTVWLQLTLRPMAFRDR